MNGLAVPGYDVWGLLGEGGMSQVWLAKHQGLAVPVVIKTLRHSLLEAQGADAAAARVRSEARLMARVSSPRIVRAIDAGMVPSSGTPFLVQEYVDGLDFAELDGRRRRSLGVGLPLWLVCHVMREIGLGLRAAHQAGVVHRDLKPSNVFGAPETGIRLGDFGIAVAVSEGTVRDAAGTLKFMAPEQFRGGEVGRFTDVWGAGATACDLRYGHAPFEQRRGHPRRREAAAHAAAHHARGGVFPAARARDAREGRAPAPRGHVGAAASFLDARSRARATAAHREPPRCDDAHARET